jgi:hypothetical protein
MRNTGDMLEMACHASPLDSPLSVIFNVHPRSHSYRLVYLPWTLPFTLAFYSPSHSVPPVPGCYIYLCSARPFVCRSTFSHDNVQWCSDKTEVPSLYQLAAISRLNSGQAPSNLGFGFHSFSTIIFPRPQTRERRV